MELVQVRLLADDFGSMFRFYRDVLGLKPQVDDDSGPYGKLSLPSGNAAIALQSRAHLQESLPTLTAGAPDKALIALKVDDVDATLAKLRERGVLPLSEPTVQWGRMKVAYLRDPEQNLIELQQWLPQPAPTT
jgi:catechol 2,3-dioxygenase-like lactoylglutathione lyase family enzyme